MALPTSSMRAGLRVLTIKVRRAAVSFLMMGTSSLTALLSMLNSCASGVSVVNIDNGFGAGYQASMITHMEVK